MPSLPLLKALGLNFSPNQLEVAPGSLVEASNVIIRRDDVIESRRGFALYGTAMGTSSDRCKQLLTYKNKLIRHFSNRLQFENGLNNSGVTSFFDFNEIVNGVTQQAQITEAEPGLRIKSIEANSNLYFTTSEGIKKISAKSSNAFAASAITKAGGVKALDMTAELITEIGDQSGFLFSDSGVSYKVVWGTKDANGSLILGSPSNSATVINSLFELTLKDFCNFLLQLDNTANSNPGNSLISDNNYYSTLGLLLGADSSLLRSNLIACAKKLDEDLLYASDAGTTLAYDQLKIAPTVSTTASITEGLSTITVASSSGILEGMIASGIGIRATVLSVSGTTVTLSSASSITSSSVSVSFYGMGVSNGIVTSVFFNTLAVTASDSSGDLLFTSGSSHGFKAGMPVQFAAATYPGNISSTSTTYYVIASGLTANTFKVSATSGGNSIAWSSAGSSVTVGLAAGAYFISADEIKLSGFKSNSIEVSSLNSNNTVSSVNANRISFIPKNYSANNPIGVSGTIVNIPTTSVNDAGTVVLTSTSHGLKSNQKIDISGSNSIPSINGSAYPITVLSENTFSIDLKTPFSTPNFGGTISIAIGDIKTDDTITYNSHGLLNGDSVVFTALGGAIGTGLAINTRYYVIDQTTNTFKISTSPGGTAVDITTANTGAATLARAPTQYITSTNHGYVAGDTVTFNVTSPTSEAVTFAAATDTVTLSSATPNLPHGFNNGDAVQFTSIVTTTGISQNTKYYVVNATATSFQLATTAEGTALPLTNDGTGVMQRLNSSLTYYVISNGLTPNTFQVSSSLNGSVSTVTGTGTVTKQITVLGNSATWNVVIDGIASSKIESNLFRSIPEPEETSVLITNNQAVSLSDYYSNILSELQNVISIHNNTIVDSSPQPSPGIFEKYLSNLDVTNNAYAKLTFTIPSTILNYSETNNPYFYQIYRTDIAEVSGVSSVSDIAIIEEYKQIEEKFPTQAELTSGIIEFIDETPESIAGTGANLYTNERTGEGGLQANDTPPFAKDINTFKGYTFFSNTKTKQRKTITLIGVVNMFNKFNVLNPYKLTISNGQKTNTYNFIKGQKQVTTLTCAAASTLVSSGASNYFLLYSANNETEYYVWYQNGTSADPELTDLSLANKSGIQVVVNSSDVNSVVAEKTKNAINAYMTDFTSSATTNVVTITNLEDGPATNALIGTLPIGFSVSTVVGIGENLRLNYTVTSGSPVISCANHGFVAGDAINLGFSSPSPTNLGQTYYVSATGLLPNSFRISSTVGGSTITFTESTSGVVQFATNNVLISSSALGSVGIAIEDTAKSLIRIINRNPNEIINGFYLSGITTAPGTILLESRDLSDEEFYLLGSDSTIGASFNPDLSPNTVTIGGISATNPTTITTTSAHDLLNGDKIIISNSNSTPNINGIYEITWLSGTSFSIPVNVTSSGSGTAVFESLGTAEGSSNEEQPHRVYYSKFQQPESVPIVNYLDIGATDKQILRIFPLRDSLFVFKQDGLFRISGELAPFSVSLFDSSCVLIAPDSVSVANNQVYGWTTQGISTITEAGVNVISRAIDTEILKKASSQYTNFKTATWGVGYESDNSYTVYTTNDITDVYGTIGFRYSNLTNSWTVVDKTTTCGIVNPLDDKLYLGAGDTNYLEKERKEFTRYDYADRELSSLLGLGSILDNTLTLSSVSGISAGDVVVQDQTLTVYEFNLLLKKLDDDSSVPSNNYASLLSAQAGDNLRAKLVSLAAKLDVDLPPGGYSALIASSSGSVLTASVANPTVITTSAPHGLQSGRYITISGNSQNDINGLFPITFVGFSSFTIPVDLLFAGTGGSFVSNDNSFDDLKICYNLIINKLNSDPNVAFNNYRLLDNSTIQEAIVTAVKFTEKKLTLNLSLEFIQGPITIYKAIPCKFTYSPLTLGDPLGLKHMREATMMFANKAFTSASLKISTDLLPEFIYIPFNGDGNGIFGHQSFGSGFFGGASNSAPFRTFIPRQCQRCRFINLGFEHRIAREQYAIYGSTLTGEVGQSTRAYR